jgi:protein-L-isoaspartate(D-aspartate) O-methyltransferase
MVEEQLIPRGIKDPRVLAAFYKVDRHKFIPQATLTSAYGDFPLAIGEGQTISQPYIVALMSECLSLTGREKVLEIGTGSGYQAAILAELAGEVYSIERLSGLAEKSQVLLGDLGYANIKLKVGDGTLGWPEFAPFERIIITAAAPRVPLPLTEQLSDNGKLIMPQGNSFSQTLTLFEKREGKLKSREICACVFVPLVGKFS